MNLIDFPKKFKDPEDNEYVLKRSTWSHIVAGQNPHGEFVGHIEEIRKCIENPADIFESKKSDVRYIYRRMPDKMDYKFVVVVVDRADNLVVTAYPANNDDF